MLARTHTLTRGRRLGKDGPHLSSIRRHQTLRFLPFLITDPSPSSINEQARLRSSVVGAGNQYAAIRLASRYSLPGKRPYLSIDPLSSPSPPEHPHEASYTAHSTPHHPSTPPHKPTGLISESSDGITYMQNLDALIAQAETDWPSIQVCVYVCACVCTDGGMDVGFYVCAHLGTQRMDVGALTPPYTPSLHPSTHHQARLERIRELVVKKENLILNLTGDRQTLGDALVRKHLYICVCGLCLTACMRPTCASVWARERGCVLNLTGNRQTLGGRASTFMCVDVYMCLWVWA